jgi:hypothetical protein
LRFTFFLFFILAGSSHLYAQKDSADKIFAFKITAYIKSQNDSISIVQILKPASLPVAILDKQLAVLNHCYKTGTPHDTAMIGWGRCNLIKGEYYYFGIRLKKQQRASEGDLLYAKVKVPFVYDGLLLNVMNHAISFTNVYGENFVEINAVFTNTKKDELKLLDSMVSDIRFTGSEMLKQMPDYNKPVNGGIYNGKKLFNAMQAVTRNELELFLKYIMARPGNYAGNNWKISEIFATWMDGATPTVVEN